MAFAALVSSSVRRRVPGPDSAPNPDSDPDPDPYSDPDCALGQMISHWLLPGFNSVPAPQDTGGGGDGGGGDEGGVNMQMHFLLEEHEPELPLP